MKLGYRCDGQWLVSQPSFYPLDQAFWPNWRVLRTGSNLTRLKPYQSWIELVFHGVGVGDRSATVLPAGLTGSAKSFSMSGSSSFSARTRYIIRCLFAYHANNKSIENIQDLTLITQTEESPRGVANLFYMFLILKQILVTILCQKLKWRTIVTILSMYLLWFGIPFSEEKSDDFQSGIMIMSVDK